MRNQITPLCLFGAILLISRAAAFAQTNSWTNSVSGNWEDAYWSLGLPTTNQDVALTNAGWKALAIGSNTVQHFPDTLTMDSVTISSPTNSFNTLLLNYAGMDTPLTVRSLSIASNSAMTMRSSALSLDGPGGVGMQLGGQFDQTDSTVSGSQVNVGYIGPGIYNLNSGFFAITNLWVGGMQYGTYNGIFNQNGGTNSFGITHVEGGEYILNDGYFGATIYFTGNGTFRQKGGTLNSSLRIDYGNYIMEGGTHIGNVMVPPDNSSFSDLASYSQWDGSQTDGSIIVSSYNVYTKGGGGYPVRGSFSLYGGTVSCSELNVSGKYHQTGGTNNVSGLVYIYGSLSGFSVDAGLLCASNIWMESAPVSMGGTIVVTNEIRVAGGFPGGYLGSGDLTVSNVTLTAGGHFQFRGSSLNQSGVLNLMNGDLYFSGVGAYNLGRLQAGGGALEFYYSPPCVVHFADSSGMMWPDSAVFVVRSWNGSLYGGGGDRIIFGANSSTLTPQQLSQIQFQNPPGLPPGNYSARILATGEIVPDGGAPLQPVANLICSTNGVMHLTIGGDIGRTYAVEVSTDLVYWTSWATQFNNCGTMTFDDDDSTNCPQRFYRAHLMP